LVDAGRSGYRQATLSVERLWTVLEDRRQPEGARVAAAVALHEGLDGVGKERLRVAASTCASPRLRVVLEAVGASSSEQALAEAIAATEVDEGHTRAAGL
jgi:hypothetical protein